MTPQFSYAELSQLKIHYAHSDNKDKNKKPLLLCLHGFPEFWRTWRHQIQHLNHDYFVVAPDLRGYNLSDKPQSLNDYCIEHLVNDALELIDHLNYQAAYLVGHDWGGNVAWALASLHPTTIKKLTIINSPHPRIFQQLLGNNKQQIAASSYFLKFLNHEAEEKLSRNNYDLLWRFGFNELVEKGVFTDADMSAHIEAWSQDGALNAMLALYRAANFQVANTNEIPKQFELNNILANQVTVPTQVIWGLDDTALTPACLYGLENYVTTLRIRRVEKAGHGIIHEFPELINQVIRDFMKP